MTKNSANNPAPEASEIEAQLEKLIAGNSLNRSDRLIKLLTHIVRQSLEGNTENLLGKNIAKDFLGQNGENQVDDFSTIRVEIGRLRRRIREYYTTQGSRDSIRIDIPKGGYIATFERIDATQPSPQKAAIPLEIDLIETANRSLKSPRINVALIAILCVCGATILWWIAPWQKDTPDATRVPKIAVLQFTNASNEAENNYLANGFTTELVVAMSDYQQMVVVSRAATARYKNASIDVQEIGRNLSAQYVLRGNIRRHDSQLKVTVELAEARTAEIIWGDTYVKKLMSEDHYKTAATIAEQVARVVAKPYGIVYHESLRKVQAGSAASFSSYQCILKAYDYERKRGAKYHREVRDCLEYTVKREPMIAVAWVLLSSAYLDEFRNSYNTQAGALARAEMAAQRAVQLDPQSPPAQWSRALVQYFQRNLDEFMTTGEKAMELGSNDPDMIANFGFKLVVSGANQERGIELVEQAMEMSPVHPPLLHFPHTIFYYNQRKYEEALKAADKVTIPKLYMSHMFRAMILGQLGHAQDAQAAAAQTVKLKPNFIEDARADFYRRSIPDAVIEHMIDGLRKAGLKIQ